MARDLAHLDHEVLVSLGVTATGHRKRILRLVSHVQRSEGRANQTADLTRERCQSVTEWRRGAGPGPPHFPVFRNSSAPDLAAMLPNSAGDKPVKAVKPVPKPRTVFNRRRTVPVHFRPHLEAVPPPPRRLSQDYMSFQEVEGPSGDPSSEPRRSWSMSAPGHVLPPVPPRMKCGVRPTLDQGFLSSLSSSPLMTEQTPPVPAASSPGDVDNTSLSGFSPSSSPRTSRMEMVSNEIYWGTLPGSAGARSHSGPRAAPPTPPRQAADPQRSR